jgi:hypothetical protein
MSKYLNPHEKDALTFQLATLLNYDEPSAMLATLQRIAERKAFAGAKRRDYDAALSWQELVDALDAVRQELERVARHRPQRAKVSITEI